MDTATGAFTTIGSTADLTGLAYDYTTQTMFGVDFGGTLYTIDLETGASTVVGNTGGVLIDCACDNDGILYAVDIGSDVFGSIDKTTATFTTISNLPFDANYAQGMQCDHGCERGVSCSLQQFIGSRAVVQCRTGHGYLYADRELPGQYGSRRHGHAGRMDRPDQAGLPDNLLGYNVYRDGDFVAYTPHTPAGEYVPQGYVDEGLTAGHLSIHGNGGIRPGPLRISRAKRANRWKKGLAEVTVDFCYDLEFMETWSLGNFDDNNWLTDGSQLVDQRPGRQPVPGGRVHVGSDPDQL